MTKFCKKCNKFKGLSDFSKDRTKFDGLQAKCKLCTKSYNIEYYKLNSSKIIQSSSNYYQTNKLAKLTYSKIYRNKNLVKKRKYDKQYREFNKDKIISYFKIYRFENRKYLNALKAAYKASKINATPKWLSEQQLVELKEIYKNCPKGFHVDHIVPLRGKNVSGLHVPWNLQYLPAKENVIKGNKF